MAPLSELFFIFKKYVFLTLFYQLAAVDNVWSRINCIWLNSSTGFILVLLAVPNVGKLLALAVHCLDLENMLSTPTFFFLDIFSYFRLRVSSQAFAVVESITYIYIDRYILQAKTA